MTVVAFLGSARTRDELRFLRGLGTHANRPHDPARVARLLTAYLRHRTRYGYPPGVSAVRCERYVRKRLVQLYERLERGEWRG